MNEIIIISLISLGRYKIVVTPTMIIVYTFIRVKFISKLREKRDYIK